MQNNNDHDDDESKTSLRHVPNEDMMGSLVRHRRRVSPILLLHRSIFDFVANGNVMNLSGCILATR